MARSQESVAKLGADGEVEVDGEKLNALRKIVMQAIERRSAHAEEAQQESGSRRPCLCASIARGHIKWQEHSPPLCAHC